VTLLRILVIVAITLPYWVVLFGRVIGPWFTTPQPPVRRKRGHK
jgi:hypothetical protein